jgi:alanine-glyoxylate transaminase/serine-glyoxylate transaminase/serine-pyruvate transaminase
MLTGKHHLFVPGPTNVPAEVMRAIHAEMEDHRSPLLPAFTKPLMEDVKQIFKTDKGTVFIFPASGTGGWESALQNTLSPGDKVLIARYGQFSHLWIDMAKRLHLDVIEVEAEWGTGVPEETFAQILRDDTGHDIKAVLMTHNETATGVTSDVAPVRKVLDAASHPALLFVDGVSSIGSIDFRMDEWGVDVAVSGSQKGFMLPAGLAIIAVSEKALAARADAKLPRCFFDWDDHLNTNPGGYFPYTPAMPMLRGLRVAVDRLLEEGLENVFARHHRLAEGVRSAVRDGWGYEICAKEKRWESDTVTTILVPENIDGAQVVKRAATHYNLALGAGLSKLAGKAFRIGHLGDLNELMLCGAISGAEMILREMGADVKPGSGVAAATTYWLENER